jgi:hypothetical protein
MYKLICNQKDCLNKSIAHYFLKVQDSAMCGGCKAAIVPIVMTEAEIADTFDYDYKAKPSWP